MVESILTQGETSLVSLLPRVLTVTIDTEDETGECVQVPLESHALGFAAVANLVAEDPGTHPETPLAIDQSSQE